MWKMGILPGLANLLLIVPCVGAQETVYKNVSKEKIEAILRELKIEYRSSESKSEGTYYYYFKYENYDVRLHNYNGKDLWIDCIFTDKLTPEQVNRWNIRAKLSRAVFIRDGTLETVSLESQIDCLGGVTDAIIKRFIGRFNTELDGFSKFISK
jgi:hypothetical protein